MKSAYSKLITLVKKIRLQIFLITLIEEIILFIGMIITTVFLLSLLDYFFSFPSGLRQKLLILSPVSLLILFVYLTFLAIRVCWRKEKIAFLVQNKYPILKDNFINALQLGERESVYFSPVLVNALIEQVAEKIKIVQPYKITPRLRLKKYILFTFLCFSTFLLFHLSFPKVLSFSLPRLFLIEYTPEIKVSPGNFSLFRGNDIEIVAEIPSLEKEIPFLIYRSAYSAEWNKKAMSFLTSEKYHFIFHSLLENLEYQVYWGKLRSPIYQVKIIHPPEIGDLVLKYHYPAYTQLPAQVVEKTNGDILTLAGTRVVLTAEVSKRLRKAKIILADGQTQELRFYQGKGKKMVEGEILANKENTYWFELLDEEGYANPDSPHYKIQLVKDEFPKIALLTPTEDLVVSEKIKLKLTYEVSDDFGVKELNLFYRRPPGQSWQSLMIKQFPPGVKEKLDDWDWDLSRSAVQAGETIEYYLEVTDNDTVSGPKKSSTKSFKLEIFSYEREHREIEKELYGFREQLLDLLSEQIKAKELAEKISQLPSEQQLPLWQELNDLQEKVRQRTGENIKNLTQTLERMKYDPLTTQRTYEEYNSLRNNLDYLHSQPMEQIFKPINEHNLPETKHKQEEIVTTLEKMTLLSEDVLEYQRMYDLLTSAQELNEIGSKLNENLEKITSLDEKTTKEFNETLGKIGQLFEKIQQLLMKMPEELPEEFINQPAVKEINLGQTQDLLSQLREALAQGDLSSALKYAKSLASNLSRVLETLQQAAQSSAYTEMDKLGQELNQHSLALSKLIEKEQGLIEKTSKYETKRLDKLLKFQEDLLQELSEKQKKVIEQTGNLSKYPDFTWSLEATLSKMEKVYTEFVEKRVSDSPKLLKEIIEELKSIKFFAENELGFNLKKYENWKKIGKEKETKGEKLSAEFLEEENKFIQKEGNFKTIISQLDDIKQKEAEILDLLKKGSEPEPSIIFTENERIGLQNLAREQNGLTEQTRNLNRQLQELSRKSALLGPQLSLNLRNAQGAMQNAEKGLSGFSTGKALDEEKDALYWLSQGKEGLNQVQEKLAGGEKKVTQPVAGFIQYPASGIYGVRIGYVKLPGAEEYKPPKEFRQEILEALKEKYPKLYEELIKEYYKRLTE